MGSYMSSFLCTVLAVTYPVYASFKAIESEDKGDDTMWLIYWVVYSVFALFESIADWIVFWVPFYYEIKLIFLLLLQFPQLQLCNTIYTNYVRPLLKKNEAKIDAMVQDASTQANAKFRQAAANAGPRLVSAVMNASQKPE